MATEIQKEANKLKPNNLIAYSLIIEYKFFPKISKIISA